MNTRNVWKSLRAALVGLGMAACASDPTGPTLATEASPALLSNLFRMQVLTRKTPLDRDITVSATIDRNGGTISIPKAGFTLTVPRGAVTSKTKFTVTALSGKLVAYEMGPHGMRFERSLRANQDLKVTNWTLTLLPLMKGAYFTDKSLLDQDSLTALVAEILYGVPNLLTKSFSFPIDHFSGYVVAW